MKSPLFGKGTQHFITGDQTKILLVFKMKESTQSDHLATVERLKMIIRKEGFDPVLVGGTYLLYGKLSKLIGSSLIEGLTLLILVFVIMGGIISRSFRVVGAMLISLAVGPHRRCREVLRDTSETGDPRGP